MTPFQKLVRERDKERRDKYPVIGVGVNGTGEQVGYFSNGRVKKAVVLQTRGAKARNKMTKAAQRLWCKRKMKSRGNPGRTPKDAKLSLEKAREHQGLSQRLKLFIEYFNGFNTPEALKKAGFPGEETYLRYLGFQILKDKRVRKALEQKYAKNGEIVPDHLILSKKQILEQISLLAVDKKVAVRDRLNALQTLGKFKGMQVEKKEVRGTVLFGSLVEAANGTKAQAKKALAEPEIEEAEIVVETQEQKDTYKVLSEGLKHPEVREILKMALNESK